MHVTKRFELRDKGFLFRKQRTRHRLWIWGECLHAASISCELQTVPAHVTGQPRRQPGWPSLHPVSRPSRCCEGGAGERRKQAKGEAENSFVSLGQKEGDQGSLMAWMRGQGFSTPWQVWGRWELSGLGSSVRKGMVWGDLGVSGGP